MILKKINSFLDIVLSKLIIFVFLLMVILVFFQVINRFIFHIPVPWTEEFSRYIFVWLSLLGTAKAFYKKGHIAMDIIDNVVKGKGKKYLNILVYILCLIFFMVMVIYGSRWVFSCKGTICQSVKLDLVYIYIVLPVSFLVMILYVLEFLIDEIKNNTFKEVS